MLSCPVFLSNISFKITYQRIHLIWSQLRHFGLWFWQYFWVFLPWEEVFVQPTFPIVLRIQRIVVTCREWPVRATCSCSSFIHAEGLLGESLIHFLCVLLSVLEGCPVVGNVTVISSFRHLLIIAFTVFHGTSIILEKLLSIIKSCKFHAAHGFNSYIKPIQCSTETFIFGVIH